MIFKGNSLKSHQSFEGFMNLLDLDIHQLRQKIVSKEIKVSEILEIYLAQAKKWNPFLGAFYCFNEGAMEEALKIDEKIIKGQPPKKLLGIPIAVKDIICTQNLLTTAGSKMLKNFIPFFSATAVERLKAEGALIIGKTSCDEFAMGSSNENSAFGLCRNPWNFECVPGGSSGGSAAAVSARMAPAALGTDTGGSIRLPAGFCGVVGVKPTYGRVSRYGLIAYASSLDQIGPMTQSVRDSALLLEIISGFDEKDSTSSQKLTESWSSHLSENMKGKRIGLVKEYDYDNLDNSTVKALEISQDILKKAGAEFVEVSIPNIDLAIAIYYVIATCEASSNLSRFDGVRYGFRSQKKASNIDDFYINNRTEGFGEEVKRRILLGTFCLSKGHYNAFFEKASRARRVLRTQFKDALKEVDVLLTPLTLGAAFKIGEASKDPLSMYLNDLFTTAVNLVGLPAIAIPAILSEQNLPIGIQLIADDFEEQKMFDVANHIENALHFRKQVAYGIR